MFSISGCSTEHELVIDDNGMTEKINIIVPKTEENKTKIYGQYQNNLYAIDNDYTKKKANSNLVGMTDFILNNKPVMTGWGVLFKQRGIEPNPLVDMIASFMDLRDIHKSQMFQFPKGSEEFEKYKLAQLLII